MTSSELHSLIAGPVSKCSHILRCWRFRHVKLKRLESNLTAFIKLEVYPIYPNGSKLAKIGTGFKLGDRRAIASALRSSQLEKATHSEWQENPVYLGSPLLPGPYSVLVTPRREAAPVIITYLRTTVFPIPLPPHLCDWTCLASWMTSYQGLWSVPQFPTIVQSC